jgi:large subunit ribosomal protein L21
MEVGAKKKFDQVLLLVDEDRIDIGTPYLKDVQVEATVVSHFKGEKITVFKYRPKQRYRVKTGHRQKFSRLMVDAITYPGMAKREKTLEKKEDEKASGTQLKEEPAGKKKPASKKSASGKKTTTAKTAPTTKKTASTKKTAATAKKATSSAKKAEVKKNTSKAEVAATKRTDIKKPKKES